MDAHAAGVEMGGRVGGDKTKRTTGAKEAAAAGA
jgi:hypothetical protein